MLGLSDWRFSRYCPFLVLFCGASLVTGLDHCCSTLLSCIRNSFGRMSSQQLFSLSRVQDVLHDYIFSGGILKGGTWGGNECKESISLQAHTIEMILWFGVCYIIHRLCQYKQFYREMIKNAEVILKDHERSVSSKILDVVFGCLHFGIWFLVLYYKITMHSLINLCQPCHIALFVQGLGVVMGGAQGAVIGIVSLPLVVGPIGAIAVPALDGLDQPYEKLFFFIQHYLLLVTPLFLLLRNNYCSYKLITFRSLVYANWGILVLHWFIFAVRSICMIALVVFVLINIVQFIALIVYQLAIFCSLFSMLHFLITFFCSLFSVLHFLVTFFCPICSLVSSLRVSNFNFISLNPFNNHNSLR